MNTTGKCHYLAETIAEVTNLKILEHYRGHCTMAEARCYDHELTDLARRIIEAISAVPEPDEYETWLQQKTCTGCAVADLKPTENEPVQDLKNSTASIDPETEQQIESRTLSDGGEPDAYPALFKDLVLQPVTTPDAAEGYAIEALRKSNARWIEEVLPELPAMQRESNESPATAAQQQATAPGVDNVPEIADCGAEQGTPDSAKNPKMTLTKMEMISLEKRLRKFKTINKLTIENLVELTGVSNFTISSILRKDNVSRGTYDKVDRAMRNFHQKKMVELDQAKEQEPDPPKINGTGRGPGDYMRLKLLAWLNNEHLGLSQASSRLMVQESALRKITIDGEMPHSNVVNQLCKYVPAIAAERAMLMDAARKQEGNGQGVQS